MAPEITTQNEPSVDGGNNVYFELQKAWNKDLRGMNSPVLCKADGSISSL